SISRETPFLVITVSSSLATSSKVKPYWKPEQPPPCTNTRNFRSGLPSSAIRSATFAAALSVKISGAGISVSICSATTLISTPHGYSSQILLQMARELRSGVFCRQLEQGLVLGRQKRAQLAAND